jgi:RNA polymerase sigma-70 factor (ECF subfamily)
LRAKDEFPGVILVIDMKKGFTGIDIRAWYEKYVPMVFRRCKKMLRNEEDAADAVQDVFERLLKAEKRLCEQFPSSLLYTIATNICLNKLRWKKRRKETDRGGDPGELSLFADDKGYGEVEAKMIMDAILKNESELTRTICFMYYADDMTLKEIGEAMGFSVSGVRKRLLAFKARARIKLGGKTDE